MERWLFDWRTHVGFTAVCLAAAVIDLMMDSEFAKWVSLVPAGSGGFCLCNALHIRRMTFC